jgi:hypothetical protein
MRRGVSILCSVALCLGGCSLTSTIHKRFSIDEAPPNSLSLDAKQRLFLVTDKGGQYGANRRVVCAEPSPDAIMAIAASGELEAAMADKGSAKIAASLAEAIGELGDRTPTIQLLRDALYRACEAYLNGIFGKNDYRQILHAYNEFVVTLLAIEGFTQRPRSAPTIIQSRTDAKIANNPESQTIPATGNQNQAPSSSDPGKLVSDEVAQVVRGILNDYYAIQRAR